MAEAQLKIKTDETVKGPKMPMGQRIYQGWVGAISRLKSEPMGVKQPRGAAARKKDWSRGRGSVYTEIPHLTDPAIREEAFYPVVDPFSYVRVTYNSATSEFILMEKTLEYEWEKLSVMDKRTYLEKSVDSFIKSRGMSIEPISKDKISYFISRDFVGYGPIDALMNDLHMEDVSCDGVGIPLFVFHNKFESIKTNIVFEDENDLNSFVVNLGQRCGKQLSVSNPILDGTTPEGHRVQATYAREVTTRGASFTIRRFKEKPFTPVELIKYGTASPEIVAYMWLSVEHGESAIICGGTASGKTATLNAVALFIPPGAKVVTMEDTREINLPHENWIPGTTRSGVGERGPDGKAAGEIDMYDLVRAALRQRPNYIIVGEVRGKETYTMFQAMATGHTTYSTMHADSVKGMVNRLENPPINCPRILLTALRNVLIQTHARVGMDMVRRLKQLIEIVGFEPETNELISNTVYEWDQASDKFVFKGHSFLFDKIMEMKNLTHEELQQEFERRVDIVKYMVAMDMTDHHDIWNIIRQYYKEPKVIADRVRKEMQNMSPRAAVAQVAGGVSVA